MIYKFFSCPTGPETVSRLCQILEKNTLWAASPNTFNDPFECKVALDLTASEEERRARYKKDNPSATEENFQSWNSGLDQAKWHVEQSTRSGILQTYGISCFTREWENELLWAHYAKDHTGFCIGFEESTLLQWDQLTGASDVEYRDDVYPFRFFHDSLPEFAKRTIFTKSSRWAYEQEYRLVFEGSGVKVMPPGAIVEVTIGCRASHELRQELQNMQVSSGLALYQASEMLNRYRLTREVIKKGHWSMTSHF